MGTDTRCAAYTAGAQGVRPGGFALLHAHYAHASLRGFDLGREAYYRNEQQNYITGKERQDAFSEAYAGPKCGSDFQKPHVPVGAGVLFLMHRAYEGMRLSMDTCHGFIFLFVC